MDNVEKPFTIMEWCAGYGGIGMGLKRVIRNMRTVAYSEIELFGCEILASRMEAGQIDAAPIWTDIKTFPCERFRGMVDLLVAGYPCQPFSTAGKRKGEEDPRHLWPFIQRAIGIIRPRWVFAENVSGHLTLGFKDVCHDLDELGYEVTCGLFTAREVGLPHKRQRLFILAHDKSAGAGLDERRLRRQPDEADGEGYGVGLADSDCGGGVEDSQLTELRADGIKQSSEHSGGAESPEGSQEREGEILGDPGLQGLQGELPGRVSGAEGRKEPSRRPAPDGGIRSHDLAPAGPGSEQYWWEPARVLGNAKHDGLSGTEVGGGIGKKPISGRQDQSKQEASKSKRKPTGTSAEQGASGAELGNAPSERPRGGSEDGAGEQSEVPRQGLGGVGLADPEGDCEQGRRRGSGEEQPGGSGPARDGDETVAPLGGSPDGPTDRVDGPDLLAAYHALGSSVHSRVDELRALGNGVIPAVSAKAFITLYDELTDGTATK